MMSQKQSLPKTTSWLLPVLIVLLGFLMRTADGAGTTAFRYDQARLSQIGLEMTAGEIFPLLGIQSSAGVPNSPMTVYVLAPFFMLSSNPLVVTLFIILLNIIGLAVLWRIAHQYFGRGVAIITTLIYAVSPYAIDYSRGIWAQNYHTPFIILGIWCGLEGFVQKKAWAQIACLPLLIIGFQIHFAAWTLMPIYLCLLWLGRKNIRWGALLTSIALSVGITIPFVLGILGEPSGTSDRASLIMAILSDGIQSRLDIVLSLISDLVSGVGHNDHFTDTAFSFLVSDTLWLALVLFALVGVAFLLRNTWRRYAILVWLWAGMTIAAFAPIWTGSGVFHHYFIPSIPAFALLIGCGVMGIVHLVQRVDNQALTHLARGALYSILTVIIIAQGATVLAEYRYNADTYTVLGESGQTATPVSYLLEVREILQDYDDVILMGANPHESNFYIWEPLLFDSTQCVRDLLILDGVIDILPAGRFAAVVAPLSPINATYEPPARYTHADPIEISLREGEDPYIIYPFDTAPTWEETPINPITTPPFDNNIQLTGYYLEDTFVRLQWDVLEAPGGNFQYFVHFLNDQGEKIGQRDVPFYIGHHWCAGDTLITGALIDLPAQTAGLRVGFYVLNEDGSTDERYLLNPDGTISQQTWVDIPLDNADSN